MEKSKNRVCFWCQKPIYDGLDTVYILGKLGGENIQINFHDACGLKASMKMMAKLEYTTRANGVNFVLSRNDK